MVVADCVSLLLKIEQLPVSYSHSYPTPRIVSRFHRIPMDFFDTPCRTFITIQKMPVFPRPHACYLLRNRITLLRCETIYAIVGWPDIENEANG